MNATGPPIPRAMTSVAATTSTAALAGRRDLEDRERDERGPEDNTVIGGPRQGAVHPGAPRGNRPVLRLRIDRRFQPRFP